MIITDEMQAALDKKQAHKDNGDQFRYRIRFNPKNWIFKYEIQYYMYWVYETEYTGEKTYGKGWVTQKKYRELSKAQRVLKELEDLNGYLSVVPKWYKEKTCDRNQFEWTCKKR